METSCEESCEHIMVFSCHFEKDSNTYSSAFIDENKIWFYKFHCNCSKNNGLVRPQDCQEKL